MARFSYSVIRFVPHPVRGERVNVGAVAGCDDLADWDLRLVRSFRRANKLDDDSVFSAALAHINTIAQQIERSRDAAEEETWRDPNVNEQWLRKLWQTSHNVVQFSEPAPVVAETSEEALDLVFDSLVLDPVSGSRGTTKHAALSALRREYKRALGQGPHAEVVERVTVVGSKYPTDFDFAVANGKPIQLTQAWSFQTRDAHALSEHVRAWAWGVRAIRDGGGQIDVNGRRLAVPPAIDIEAVYVPAQPDNAQGNDAFGEANEIFAEIDVAAVPLDRVADVANRIAVGVSATA